MADDIANSNKKSNTEQYGHNEDTNKVPGWDVKESKVLVDTAPRQRVDLRVKDFDQAIEQKGMNVCVYRTMYCPNVKSVDAAEHEINCPLCNGSGFIDTFPIRTKGYIQNQELEKIQNLSGFVDGNTVAITFPIGIELQYFTKVELIDFTEIYYQRVQRTPASTRDVLKYQACRVNVLVDVNGNNYYQDQDFRLDQNGSILWFGPRTPADNTIYSIHYEAHVQFRAVKAMHVTRFTQHKVAGGIEHIKMPEQWMCTKEFLVRRKDSLNGQDLQQGPFSNWTPVTDDS
jgi:hypothetical protein